ncbi:MAG: LemA family protein [Nitriliruptoraceae bacterium]
MEPLIIVLLAIAAVPLLGIFSYNRFIAQAASIEATWANIEAELQRRHDLVPNLVATVEGYASHERGVLEQVTEARTRAVASVPTDVTMTDQARAEDALTQGLTTLLAITESYPDLQSDTAFRDLQRQLVETEDRIAAARRLYNLEVAAFERRRQAVPSNLVASALGFDAREMFEIRDPAAEHAPHVAP